MSDESPELERDPPSAQEVFICMLRDGGMRHEIQEPNNWAPEKTYKTVICWDKHHRFMGLWYFDILGEFITAVSTDGVR